MEIKDDQVLEENMPIRVKVGGLAEMPAAIKWIQLLDKDVVKLGIEYLK